MTARRLHPFAGLSGVLVAVLAVLLALHLGAAGYAITHWHWSIAVVGAAVALLAAKLLSLAAFRAIRGRRRSRP